jgi:hypothetical protein
LRPAFSLSAALFFDSQVNLYAGGGVTVRFAAAPP